jgi:hypothetical protein
LDELQKIDGGRVVNVASSLHRLPSAFDLKGIASPETYAMFPIYGQTK